MGFMKRILLITVIVVLLFSLCASADVVTRENLGEVTTSFTMINTAQVFKPFSSDMTMVELQRHSKIRGEPDGIPVIVRLYAVDEDYLPTGKPLAEARGDANRFTLTVKVPLKATNLDTSKYYALVFITGNDDTAFWRLGLTPKAPDWDVNENAMYFADGTWTSHPTLTFWFKVYSK
jgi:opacity protein-like surface antigen